MKTAFRIMPAFCLPFILCSITVVSKAQNRPFSKIGDILLTEAFSQQILPEGWQTYENSAGVGGGVWQFNNPGSRTLSSPTGGTGFAIFDSDKYGDDTKPEDATLLSRPFSCLSYDSIITVEFYMHFSTTGDGIPVPVTNQTGKVLLSTNGGNSFFTIASYDAQNNPDKQNQNGIKISIKITDSAQNKPNVLLGFRFAGNYSWYWAIDDIKVKGFRKEGTPPPPKPVAAFSAGDTVVTINDTVQFIDQSSNNPSSWRWHFGDSSDGSHRQHPSHVYTKAGFYSVKLVAGIPSGSDSLIKENYIRVNEQNQPPVASDDSILINCGFFFAAKNADSSCTPYFCSADLTVLRNDYDPDGNMADSSVTITRPPQLGEAYALHDGTICYSAIKVKDPGYYYDTLQYIVGDSLGDFSDKATVFISIDYTTGIETHDLSHEITVAPNPSSGLLNINYSWRNPLIISVWSLKGQIIKKDQFLAPGNNLNLHGLPAATYLLRFFDGKNFAVKLITLY